MSHQAEVKNATESVYVRVSSHDANTKISNSQFTVNPRVWPARASSGVIGASIQSLSFPLNIENVRTGINDTLYWEFPRSGATVFTWPVGMTITLRVRGVVETLPTYQFDYGPWIEYTVLNGATITDITDITTFFNTELKNALVSIKGGVIGDYPTIFFTDTNADVTIPENVIVARNDLVHSGYAVEIRVSDDPSNCLFYKSGFRTNLELSRHRNIYGQFASDVPPIADELVFPQEWYTTDSIGAYMTTHMNTTDTNHTYTWQELDSGKLQLTTTSAQVILYAPTFKSTAHRVLGLSETTVDITSSPSTLPWHPNLHGLQSVYLHSSALAQGLSIDADSSVISIVKGISVGDVEYRGMVTYQNDDNDSPEFYLSHDNANIHEMNFTLRDHLGNALDIGAGELNFLIRFFVKNTHR